MEPVKVYGHMRECCENRACGDGKGGGGAGLRWSPLKHLCGSGLGVAVVGVVGVVGPGMAVWVC